MHVLQKPALMHMPGTLQFRKSSVHTQQSYSLIQEEQNEEQSENNLDIPEEHAKDGGQLINSLDFSALLLQPEKSRTTSFKEEEFQLENYLASIIHDFRTPLQCISLMLERLKDKNIEEREKSKCIEISLTNTNLLENYVNDILDLKQMKQGKLNIIAEQFCLANLLQSITQTMKVIASLKGIEITFENQLDPTLEIISDQRRLKQILINLFSNSIKFTSEGSIKLQTFQVFGNFIQFSVKDTGCGIAPEVIPSLTIPFNTHNTNGLNKSGVGLGLFFCKKIIGKLGPEERLLIESKLGVGSIFSFKIFTNLSKMQCGWKQNREIMCKSQIFLTDSQDDKYSSSLTKFSRFAQYRKIRPKSQLIEETHKFHSLNNELKKSGFSKSLAENTIPKSNNLNQSTSIYQLPNFDCLEHSMQNEGLQQEQDVQIITILLVDDSPFNLMIAETYLKQIKKFNFQIFKAYNGNEAIEIYQIQNKIIDDIQNIKIILMDCQMPICDGYEAAKIISMLEVQENYIKTKIIAHSGYQDSQIDKYQEYKFDGILNKPSTFTEFSEFILQLIKIIIN